MLEICQDFLGKLIGNLAWMDKTVSLHRKKFRVLNNTMNFDKKLRNYDVYDHLLLGISDYNTQHLGGERSEVGKTADRTFTGLQWQ